jgi:uncharacterized membrane protein YuzA (DUF378 family)
MNFLEENKKLITTVALILAIIGSINWGLTAFGLNIVAFFGPLAPLIYLVVGIAGVYLILVYNELLSGIAEHEQGGGGHEKGGGHEEGAGHQESTGHEEGGGHKESGSKGKGKGEEENK